MRRARVLGCLITLTLFVQANRSDATTAGPVTELATSQPMINQRAPTISWDGTRYIMVYEDSRSTTSGIDLFVARINTVGALQDPMGIPLLTPPVNGDQTEPQIVYSPFFSSNLIVWTDPRDSNLNIYAARFFGLNATIPETQGIQVTSEAPDADTAPHVAAGPSSFLIVWQSTLGAETQIRGRRLYSELSSLPDEDGAWYDLSNGGGTGEGKPRALGLVTDFVVTWEDDRNAATTGLDLYGRIVSGDEFTPVSAAPGVLLAGDVFGQGKQDQVLLGPSTLALVWEDDRLGAGVDRNIWRNLYSPTTLTPLAGGEASVSLAIEAQQRPRIAGDSNGGMIVWQDFKNGPTGITYGARLDSAGNVRDLGGFPLLAFSQNAFEHVIVKGPNNDYLVAAVRFGVASRIFYRVVRDEAPAGTMNASGTLQVPADGTSVAQIIFGPARGTSNTYDVVDGTLYTMTLSRTDVVPTVIDLAPTIPGLQVEAIDGVVSFGLSSLGHGSVTVSITSVEGTATGQGTVIFDNVPPVATNLVVRPANPTSVQDLSLTYSYSDINGDPESGTQIEWLRNSAVQSAYTGMTTVPASATIRSDQWRARVTPNDGLNLGQFVFSNTVIIGNTPPAAINLRIDPDMGVKTSTALRGRYLFDDPDSDAEADSEIRWYESNVEVTALRDLDRVPGEMVVKGQTWTFSVIPNDGMEDGPLATSPPVTVENSKPIANAGMNARLLERRTQILNGTTSTDKDPQDVLQFSWRQTSGTPQLMLSSTSSSTPSFVAPSIKTTQIYVFELVVTDGEQESPPDEVVIEVNPVIDTDADGLDDEEEAIYGTDRELFDTDRDGINDGPEVELGTNPLDSDSDDDGVRDGEEGRTCPQNECNGMPQLDSDGDQIIDVLEPDSDGDGLFDGTELAIVEPIAGTATAAGFFIRDADRDTFTNPTLADTDRDTLVDGVEDANHNGKIDPGESDPNNPADPPRACTTGGNECPPGTECTNGFCTIAVPVDGGLMCSKLADRMIECCLGSCATGTLDTPVCMAQGALEQCGVGAVQCQIGSCSGNDPGQTGGGGCNCDATHEGKTSSVFLFAFLMLAVVLRRR